MRTDATSSTITRVLHGNMDSQSAWSALDKLGLRNRGCADESKGYELRESFCL